MDCSQFFPQSSSGFPHRAALLPGIGLCRNPRIPKSRKAGLMDRPYTHRFKFSGILRSIAHRCLQFCLLFLPLIFVSAAFGAQVLWVPDNYPAIQAAINAAATDDVIYVRPGTYFENINFSGKSVSVISEQGSAVTTIDGGQHDSVVTFTGGEHGTLAGFTIRNGRSGFDTPGFGDGGGIRIANSARPVILQNVITGNRACSGVGISSRSSSPDIRENVITGNTQFGCSGGVGGGGISVTEMKVSSYLPKSSATPLRIIASILPAARAFRFSRLVVPKSGETLLLTTRRRDCRLALKVVVFGSSIHRVRKSLRMSSPATAPGAAEGFIGQLLSMLQAQNCLTIPLLITMRRSEPEFTPVETISRLRSPTILSMTSPTAGP